MFVGLVVYLLLRTLDVNPVYNRRWGPVLVTTLGCLLLLLDPTRHVLLDHGGIFLSENFLAMYCENYPKLSPMGRFCQLATFSGIPILIAGVGWFLRYPEKLQKLVKG